MPYDNHACLYDSSLSFVLTDEKPIRQEVLTQLACINSQWRNFGQGLGVSFNDLQGLAQRNDPDQTRLDYVIQKWFDMNGQGEGAPVTWNTILDIVKGPLVKNMTRAIRICEHLKAKSFVQNDTHSKNYIDCLHNNPMITICMLYWRSF